MISSPLVPGRGPAAAGFDHQPRTRLVFGPDSVLKIADLLKELGGERILLVTDAGIVAAGHASRLQQVLEEAHLSVFIFDQVKANPTTRCVENCLNLARECGIDSIVGLGGGSSMDTAKGCNFLLTNGGQMQDYWGWNKATKPMLPLVAVPTTAGTGSECQSYALIADEESHMKMACGDPKAAARIAILDPVLTISQPVRVTACTGIDAVAHAVESAVTTKRNPLSLMYSHEAFKLSVTSLPVVLRQPANLEARGKMLLAAAFAGMAIENSMLGAAHSAANPLTAHYDIVHGQAVGMMLPHVVRFNAEDPDALRGYAELASAPEIACVSEGLKKACDALITCLDSLLNLADMPRSLGDCGVTRSFLPTLAEEAARQWTAKFNPRPITAKQFVALFESALEQRERESL